MLRRMGFVFAVALGALAGCGTDESSPVAPLDTVPPAIVTGLSASVSATATPRIFLHWDPGTESDLTGYRIYRTELRDGAGSTERDQPRIDVAFVHELAEPLFVDTAVALGRSYVYEVTARDAAGNESPRMSTGTLTVVPSTRLQEARIGS